MVQREYVQYIHVLKSFHGKTCFGFIGMNTSVQGRPPLHHYSSFQSLSFLKTFFIKQVQLIFFVIRILYHTRIENNLLLEVKLLRDKANKCTKEYSSPCYCSLATAPEKVLISHNYRGSCVAFLISKIFEPNEELKVG